MAQQQQTLEAKRNVKEYRTRHGRELQLMFAALKKCSSSKDLKRGKAIHEAVIRSGDISDVRVASTLVDMYAKCGRLLEAREVFDSMQNRDVICWNALIFGYAVNGKGEIALEVFSHMELEPDALTFVAAFKACTVISLREVGSKQPDGKLIKTVARARGRGIHIRASKHSWFSDIRIQNTLLDMYAKCGCMKEAHDIFDSMQTHDVISWTALILGYAENGEGQVALDLFFSMENPSGLTFVAALKACSSLAAEEEGIEVEGKVVKIASKHTGKLIHSRATDFKCDADRRVANTLIDMYAKCGSMEDARKVFDGIKHRGVVSWNALLFGYADNGESEIVLELFTNIPHGSMDALTFVAALKACSSLASTEKHEALDKGMAIHLQAGSFDSDIRVSNTLLDLFCKCGNMANAQQVFDTLEGRDVVSWNVIILGYAENGEKEKALEMFASMNCKPNGVSFIAALKASGNLENGIAVHSRAANSGYEEDGRFANSLMDMYARCGSLIDARRVFDEARSSQVVSWTAMMFGYVEQEDADMALDLFRNMELQGCSPDSLTFVAALKACTILAMREEGKQVDGEFLKAASQEKCIAIHYGILNNGCSSDIRVASTLMDTYAKCGSIIDARMVFDRIHKPDVVCWTTIILAYADNGEGDEALKLYTRMRNEGDCLPDAPIFTVALKACGVVGTLEFGRAIHADVLRLGFEDDECLMTTLVDFYGKCGSMVDAQRVFDSMRTKNLITWTALISGYSVQGNSSKVFEFFDKMQDDKQLPKNAVTFLCVLSACSHAGLVDKGKQYFGDMPSKYGVDPTIQHYTCMVDIYGRANRLAEAMILIRNMPFTPDVITWTTLLGACRKWKNVELGKLAFDSLVALDENETGAYVLMANIREE